MLIGTLKKLTLFSTQLQFFLVSFALHEHISKLEHVICTKLKKLNLILAK